MAMDPLWWSNLEAYEECPQKFLWKRGWGVIDLGRGPGRGKPLPDEKTSQHNSLMGNVLSEAIERLYNDELWRDPSTLVAKLSEIVSKDFAIRIAKGAYIKYDENWIEGGKERWDLAPPKHILLKTCTDGILNYLKTMKRNRLLGPFAKSEVDIKASIDKDNPIAGRPDILITRDDTGTSILDGKNSRNPGRHTNPDQLRWYALCYYLAFHKLPDRLAFVYFRYPEGSPPPEGHEGSKESWTGLVDVPVVKEDLKTLAQRAVNTRKMMLKEYFEATPSTKACGFCDFKPVCAEHAAWKQANARKPKEPVGEVEKKIANSVGFVFFGGD